MDRELGSWIKQTLQEHPNAKLDDDIANSDLESSVERRKMIRKRAPIQPKERLDYMNGASLPRKSRKTPPHVRRAMSISHNIESNSSDCASGSASGASGCSWVQEVTVLRPSLP